MKFHEHLSWWDFNKTKIAQFGREQSYSKQIEILRKTRLERRPDGEWRYAAQATQDHTHLVYAHLLETEAKWYDNRRPYYKVYPCMVDALRKIKLDFNCECPAVPEGIISIRFAESHEPKTDDGNTIMSLLVHSDSKNDGYTGEEKEKLFVQVTLKDNPEAYYWFYFDTNPPNMTIEECLEQETNALSKYKEVRKLATRIALTTCMLADDPDIITTDVLSEQQGRYDIEKDETWKSRAEEKAKKRGIFGWSVGKNIEVTPHLRRPHLALRHTGPGGKIPKIVPVRGCAVKGNKLTHVPTGYMLPDGTEVENIES
jgi:hypothetical protein